MPFRRLVALRIPSGWEVAFNNFADIDDPHALTPQERDAYLSQDLLTLRSAAHVLEVGWRPDGNPDGLYRLSVVTSEWEDTGIELASPHVPVIRDAIELVLLGLASGDAPERIQAKLVNATTGG
jgi:hypothetical protein